MNLTEYRSSRDDEFSAFTSIYTKDEATIEDRVESEGYLGSHKNDPNEY